jgi:protein-disulfide isomerase
MSLRPPVSGKDNIQGNKNALIELVEYGDYECPHCGRAYPIIKKIQEKMGDRLKFVFRNFALTKIHHHAKLAAAATEAAAIQGKFWEMHDMIFEHQQWMSHYALSDYARLIGLNTMQFENDLAKNELFEKVDKDFESGLRSGVNATPTFFINGEKYNDSWEKEVLVEYLQNQIALIENIQLK